MYISSCLLAAAIVASASGALSGQVGPLTSVATKSTKKICNVLDYGAKADKKTDIGPPLLAAFTVCKTGGTVVIPTGNFAMATWVTFEGGKAWALQLDGTIYRTGTSNGNMLFVKEANDFELFSSTGNGAIQGNGFEYHRYGKRDGARILRIQQSTGFSVHDIILVDAPQFHFVMDSCTNGEAYNMVIRGANWGGLDGVDVSGSNIWIHDIMVTNKDECVTTKSPSKNILIENIYCNVSGGCAMGSLGTKTAISSITYRNVYSWNSNQMMMIKSNGGSGYVDGVLFENFIGHGNAYSLDIDQAWASMDPLPGNGVKLQNLTFRDWKGTEANGMQRGPVTISCAEQVPCTDITIDDLAMWTEIGNKQIYSCGSAYGQGACLRAPKGGSESGYAVTSSTQTVAPTGYKAAKMADDIEISTAWGTSNSIPIPTTMPSSFFPNTPPISKLVVNVGPNSV